MASQINKPTGLGFHSNLQRLCTICGHVEMKHYNKLCHKIEQGFNNTRISCSCTGFTARELTKAELDIILEKSVKELEYVDEAYILDLKEDWKRIRIEGLDD